MENSEYREVLETRCPMAIATLVHSKRNILDSEEPHLLRNDQILLTKYHTFAIFRDNQAPSIVSEHFLTFRKSYFQRFQLL